MKKNVEITLTKELVIPRDVFDMEDLEKLRDKAIAICRITIDKEQRKRCMRFALSIEDLKREEALEKLQHETEIKEKENGI